MKCDHYEASSATVTHREIREVIPASSSNNTQQKPFVIAKKKNVLTFNACGPVGISKIQLALSQNAFPCWLLIFPFCFV